MLRNRVRKLKIKNYELKFCKRLTVNELQIKIVHFILFQFLREMSILTIKKWAFPLNLKPQQRGLWSAILGTASLIETTKIGDY